MRSVAKKNRLKSYDKVDRRHRNVALREFRLNLSIRENPRALADNRGRTVNGRKWKLRSKTWPNGKNRQIHTEILTFD